MSAEDRKKMDEAVILSLSTGPKNFATLCGCLPRGMEWKVQRIIERSLQRLKREGRLVLEKGKGKGPGGTWRLSTSGGASS